MRLSLCRHLLIWAGRRLILQEQCGRPCFHVVTHSPSMTGGLPIAVARLRLRSPSQGCRRRRSSACRRGGMVQPSKPLLGVLQLLNASCALAHRLRRVRQQRIAVHVATTMAAPDLQPNTLVPQLARALHRREQGGDGPIGQLPPLSHSLVKLAVSTTRCDVPVAQAAHTWPSKPGARENSAREGSRRFGGPPCGFPLKIPQDLSWRGRPGGAANRARLRASPARAARGRSGMAASSS